MEFSYKFYAVEGMQAYKKYYIAMVPLKLLSKLIATEEEYLLPEFRAQRKINESRIPEIKNYIVENRDNYVFSALSASIDGNFMFNRIDGNVGLLEIDMNSTILMNDGQHRKAALIQAMLEDNSLGDETISIVFFEDNGLERSQQMFTDLNKHAVKTSNSLSTLYDSRDELAVFTKKIIEEIPFFKKYTDKERDILGKNSSKLFTLNSLYKANQKILRSCDLNEFNYHFLLNYWKTLSENIVEWNELQSKQITKKDLRENFIVTLSIVLIAFGKLGRFYFENPTIDYKKSLQGLKSIDWSRSNTDWLGRVLRDNGKVLNNEEAIALICIKLKQYLNLTLSTDEIRREKQRKG